MIRSGEIIDLKTVAGFALLELGPDGLRVLDASQFDFANRP